MTPQPLALLTIASAPASIAGHHASMLRRASSSAPGGSPRCWRIAPQQRRPPAERTTSMPIRSSTRALREADGGAIVACTQPSGRTTRREWRAVGHASAARRGINLSCNALGSIGRSARPSRYAGPNSALVRPLRSIARVRRAWSARARHLLLDEAAADAAHPSILYARRARGLARAAREAAIEVQLRLGRDWCTLEHLLHQVDPPARAVELITEQQVGRARRGAKSAVHARADQRLRLARLRPLTQPLSELRLHACGPD